jgi:HD-like signal output (HDOD) protein
VSATLDADLLRSELIHRAEELTPLPTAVTRLAVAINDPESSVDDICAIVGHDPVLAANLLREANSSWTGRAHVDTIERAFVLLGRARLLMLAIRGAIDDRFQPALPQYGLAKGELWQHSVAASIAASVVREHSRVDPGGESLTAALLHDFAKLVICDYVDLREHATRPGLVPVISIERSRAAIDHAELGGLICRSWGLPDSICDAIALHHVDEHDEVVPAAHAVAVADAVAHDALGSGLGFFGLDLPDVATSMEVLGLGDDIWDRLVVETQSAIAASI